YSNEDKAWVVSDSQIHLFEVDEANAKQIANQWWDSEGKEIPQEIQCSLSEIDAAEFESYKTYAVQEAGRKHVRV
ncbi:MAG: hypothetical protein RJQ14_12745, partial [Marinoscillum sp.]